MEHRSRSHEHHFEERETQGEGFVFGSKFRLMRVIAVPRMRSHVTPQKPPAGMLIVELQRIFRRDCGGAKAALRFDHRPSKDALQSQNADLIQSTGDVHARPTQKPRTAKAAVRATRFSVNTRE